MLSTQVIQELCVSLRRNATHPLSVEEVRRLIEDYLSWEIVINTPQVIIRGLELEARYKISFWDALIVQAAESSGVAILCSEDLSAEQSYGSIRVINPFVQPASDRN